MRKQKAAHILQQVTTSYDAIAAEYYRDRSRAWPIGRAIEPLIKQHIQSGHTVLDIGSGSGHLLPLLTIPERPITYVGCDISPEVIALAEKNFGSKYRQISVSWQVASMTKLPYEDNSFDAVCALAVLHHVPSHALRLHALQEVSRVLRPGGVLIMANWRLWTRVAFSKFNLTWQTLRNLIRGYDIGDYIIPWKGSSGEVKTERYYHSFTEKELTDLARAAGFSIESNNSVALTSCAKSPAVSFITVAKKLIEQ